MIKLLRELDDEFFWKSHEPELVLEDKGLDELDNTTKIWWQEMNSKSNI